MNRTEHEKNKPWVSNYPPLADWLKKISAVCNWQVTRGDADDPQAFVECWSANGRVFIIQVYANRNGWEIYTGCDSNKVDVTFADAEIRMGIPA